MSDVLESVDLLAAKARSAMQDAFKSGVERDLTQGSFEADALHSTISHSKD
jgi:hypothetical protein